MVNIKVVLVILLINTLVQVWDIPVVKELLAVENTHHVLVQADMNGKMEVVNNN